MSKTPQELGFEFDYELARLIQGVRHVGSGNQAFQRLDASGHTLIFSGKYTSHASFSIKESDLDETLRAAIGPEAASTGLIPILATKFASGRIIATLDLLQLLDWIKSPPDLLPATKQENLRRTARTPAILRGDS